MESILKRLSSRKFLLPIIYAVLVSLNRVFEFGLSEKELTQIFQLFLGFMGVEGAADVISRHVRK